MAPSLLAGHVQPTLLTLLNSTSTPSLSPLWTKHLDVSEPSSSLIHSILDTELRPKAKRRQWDTQPCNEVHVPTHQPPRGNLSDEVIHLQSRVARRTFIQIGSPRTGVTGKRRRISYATKDDAAQTPQVLGADLPHVHLQLKRLGHREMGFEVGVVDLKGREGIIRCSSSQAEPRIHRNRSIPLLHLPLQLPITSDTASTLTPWIDVAINCKQLLSLFQTLPTPPSTQSSEDEQDTQQQKSVPDKKHPQRPQSVEMPSSQFGYVSYVRVYANCRIRRIWLSAEGERTLDGLGSDARRDFALLAADSPA